MRNRWEDEAGADPDEPVTISERQLRRLRGGARAGVLALLLALVSTIASGWSLVMESDSLARFEGIQGVRERILGTIDRPESGVAPEGPPSALPDSLRGMGVAGGPDSSLAVSVTEAPPAPADTRTSRGNEPDSR